MELLLPYTCMGSADAVEILLGASCSRSLQRLDLSQNHIRDEVTLLQVRAESGCWGWVLEWLPCVVAADGCFK